MNRSDGVVVLEVVSRSPSLGYVHRYHAQKTAQHESNISLLFGWLAWYVRCMRNRRLVPPAIQATRNFHLAANGFLQRR